MTSRAHHLRTRRALAAGIAALSAIAATQAQAAALDAPPPDTVWLLSESVDGGSGDEDSAGQSLSADGRLVLFDARASDLVPGGETGEVDYDVFLHDRTTDTTVRVSRALDGGEPDGDCYGSMISGDGSTAVFASRATNLVEDEVSQDLQIYHLDLESGLTRLVSKGVDGEAGDGHPQYPLVSGNGRFVVYSSEASNLVPGDDNGTSDVFLWDAQDESTTLLSATPAGEAANNWSGGPSITEDGSTVVFDSYATDLTDDDIVEEYHVFLWRDGVVELISRDRQGRPAGGNSPKISPDGGHVGFTSQHAFTPRDTNKVSDVYLLNLASGRVRLVSTNPSGVAGVGDSHVQAVSGHARSITFGSWADDLVVGDDNRAYDIFVRDRREDVRVVSKRPDGVPADQGGQVSAIDRHGRVIAFTSSASDLVDEDDNGYFDVFLHRQPRD